MSDFNDGGLAGQLLLVATLPEDFDVATMMDAEKRRDELMRYTYRVQCLMKVELDALDLDIT